LFIINNPVDPPQHNENIYRDNPGKTKLLFLGLISKNKGIFDLIDVLATNKESFQNRLCLSIGGNGETDKLRKEINDKKLGEMVEYLGWVTQDKKNNCLQQTDVYILPSYNEGLPISILEAMSYGKPIISTNVGGIPEIVVSGRNGLLIEPGNLKQMEEAINFCIENVDTIKEYGKESRLLVKKHLPDAVMEELQKVYNELLSENV